jgi:putative flippase GtrA
MSGAGVGICDGGGRDALRYSRRDAGATVRRWLKFNLVGAVGIGVQLAALAALRGWGVNYLVATALAVETAVVHNFLWHERFTWADRVTISFAESAWRLLRFNLTTGIVSIGGNLLLMRLFVGQLHIHYIVANLLTIATCGLANFLVSDRVVFRPAWWRD